MPKPKKSTLEKRLIQSKKIARQADVAFETLCRMPSFSGKARFMDKLRRVKDNADQLVADLGIDLKEESQL